MRQDVKPERSADPAALVLGYFNFSSGTFDPAAWRAMSDLFAALEAGAGGPEGADTAQAVASLLRERLGVLQASEPAFRDARQAERLLEILFGELLPAYRTAVLPDGRCRGAPGCWRPGRHRRGVGAGGSGSGPAQ